MVRYDWFFVGVRRGPSGTSSKKPFVDILSRTGEFIPLRVKDIFQQGQKLESVIIHCKLYELDAELSQYVADAYASDEYDLYGVDRYG